MRMFAGLGTAVDTTDGFQAIDTTTSPGGLSVFINNHSDSLHQDRQIFAALDRNRSVRMTALPCRGRQQTACCGARERWGLLLFNRYAIFNVVSNKPVEMNIGAAFERMALRVLRAVPELRPVMSRGRPLGADAVVQYGGSETPVAIECKARVNSAAAHQIAHRARQLQMPLVVIAEEMTATAREILDEAGVGSIDGLGNVHLELPGLIMKITGTKRRPRRAASARLSGKSGVVAEAMLLDIEESWSVAQLAGRCRVSPGLVHRVLLRLEHEGVVTPSGAGPHKIRRVSSPAALLDLWAEEQRDPAWRQPATMAQQAPDQLIAAVCAALESTGVDYALTGAAAADYALSAAAATAAAPSGVDVGTVGVGAVGVVEVWVASSVDLIELCARIGAEPTEAAASVVLSQERDDTPLVFRARAGEVWTANVLRLYCDLRRDPHRGRELSEHLRRELIGF